MVYLLSEGGREGGDEGKVCTHEILPYSPDLSGVISQRFTTKLINLKRRYIIKIPKVESKRKLRRYLQERERERERVHICLDI